MPMPSQTPMRPPPAAEAAAAGATTTHRTAAVVRDGGGRALHAPRARCGRAEARRTRGAGVGAAVVFLAWLLAWLLAGCAAPATGAGAPEGGVYVADALDGTVVRLAAPGGRPAGPPLPAGPAPWQLAPGPDGALLVLSADAAGVGTLTLLDGAGGRGAPRRVAVGARTRQALLAGDGGPLAVVAYTARGGPAPAPPAACGLDVVDARAGRVLRTHAVCAPGAEAVTGLAVENGPGGATVYLAVARPLPPGAGGAAGRVVALDAASGARLAGRPLAGLAGALVLAQSPDGAGPRLYGVELPAGADPDESPGDHARLLGLDPATLGVERAYPLGFRPRALAVAPDGARAYALAATGHRLMELDLLGGAERRLADVPGGAQALAVAGPHLYVPDPSGGAVLVFDRRSGDLIARVPVGRRPAGVLAVNGDRLSGPDTSGDRPWAADRGGPPPGARRRSGIAPDAPGGLGQEGGPP